MDAKVRGSLGRVCKSCIDKYCQFPVQRILFKEALKRHFKAVKDMTCNCLFCRNLNKEPTQPPSRAKENNMIEANENADKCVRSIPRSTSDVVCELSYERKEVSNRLAKLNKAIEADPKAVSEHHKELWRKQTKAMQEYVDVLGERIKDLIDNG